MLDTGKMEAPAVPIDASLFDTTVTPGDDFFRHVNGGWLDANPVPPEYGAWGAFHELNERNEHLLRDLLEAAARDGAAPGTPAKMAGDYYAAAMDADAVEAAGTAPLRPFLDAITSVRSLGGLPAALRALLSIGVGALHTVESSADFDDPDVYLTYIGQGGLGLPERGYYLRDDDATRALREAYREHIAVQLAALGECDGTPAEAAGDILAFETKLAVASYSPEQLRDVQLTLNRFAVDALDELMPGFGLRAHIVALGVSSASVSIDNPGFFTALGQTLSETPLATLRDYLRWQLVRTYANALPSRFADEAFAFYGRTLGGQQEQRPRWKRMLQAATADIGEQVAQLFVAATFPEEAKRRCENLVDHLLASMGRAIRDAAWMAEPTRSRALAKLAGFTYKIGYPDVWRDYSALTIERGPHAQNRIRAAAFEHERQMSRLGTPVDRTEWEMPAHLVNAYYHPLLNEVVFPAGILQPPFFYAEADDAVNYGAIGTVIGHEITHGFDDQGSRFDATGALRDWWTAEARAEFTRRAEVLVAQYDEYEVAEGVHVNGRLTLGENIADLGGVKVAYSALKEAMRERTARAADGDALPAENGAPLIDGLTAEQRFFIAYATMWRQNVTEEYTRLLANIDPHSPARLRVNAVLANVPAFAAAFELDDSAKLVRRGEELVSIW